MFIPVQLMPDIVRIETIPVYLEDCGSVEMLTIMKQD